MERQEDKEKNVWEMIHRQMTNGWVIEIQFTLNGPALSLVCGCGKNTPREDSEIGALMCERCGRALTLEQVRRMIKEAVKELTELFETLEE